MIEDGETTGIPEGIDEDDTEIEQVVLLNIGETRPRPHLLVSLAQHSHGSGLTNETDSLDEWLARCLRSVPLRLRRILLYPSSHTRRALRQSPHSSSTHANPTTPFDNRNSASAASRIHHFLEYGYRRGERRREMDRSVHDGR